MQLVWRDYRTEYLQVILILLIQKSHTQTVVFWQLFMEIKLLNKYRDFALGIVNVGNGKASYMPLF